MITKLNPKCISNQQNLGQFNRNSNFKYPNNYHIRNSQVPNQSGYFQKNNFNNYSEQLRQNGRANIDNSGQWRNSTQNKYKGSRPQPMEVDAIHTKNSGKQLVNEEFFIN